MNTKIPLGVLKFAYANKINISRDETGEYFIRDYATKQIVERTITQHPTVENALAMCKRYLRYGNKTH
jgi:hypothetical protein